MPKNIFDQYEEAFSGQSSFHDAEKEYHINRIGLWNVHSRIRLTFGENYGLSIIKSDETGTIIQVKLPYTD